MDDKESIQSFKDMVDATEKLTKPWKYVVAFLLAALVLTNAIWGFVLWKQLEYAYMTPMEFGQEQMFEDQTQSQNYSSGITNGE